MRARDVLMSYRLMNNKMEELKERKDRLKRFLSGVGRRNDVDTLSEQEINAMRKMEETTVEMVQLQAKMDALGRQIRLLVQRTDNHRLRFIVCQYYMMGMKDDEIAETLHYSTRYVNKLRNAFLHELDGEQAVTA